MTEATEVQKSMQETRARVILSKDGKQEKPSVLPETRYTDEEWLKERADEGYEVTVEVPQSFTFYRVAPDTLDADFAELVPDVNERTDLVNTALTLKQQQFVRKQLLNKDFVPVDGAIDLHDVCGQVTERKSASPEQKAANAFSKLLGRAVSLDELNTLISMMNQGS